MRLYWLLLYAYLTLHLLLTPTTYAQLPPAVAVVGVLPSYDITTRAGINEPPSPPAAEYLGTGYDIVRGNPAETEAGGSIDPGFRQSVMQLLYDIRDSNGGYQQPYGSMLKMIPSCNQAVVASEISTVQAYQAFLALDVTVQNVAAAMINATDVFRHTIFPSTGMTSPANTVITYSFAASPSLQVLKQALAETDSVSFYSRALCYEYQLEFRSYIQPVLTDNFINAVATLPDTYPAKTDTSVTAAIVRAKMLAFIAEFGTHYTHRIVVGGKRVVSVSMQSSLVQQLKLINVSIPIMLSAMNMFSASSQNNNFATTNITTPFTFGVDVSVIDIQSIFASITQRRESTIGGSPFLTFEEWARSISGSNRAVPIQYTLKPLYVLLSGAKQIALRLAIQAYIDQAAAHLS